ncbi:MAG: hypothetical protein WBW04_20515 [Nitrolancea sp.]
MGQTGSQTGQIEDQIERQRQELADNILRLESKVQRTTDWRVQYQERTVVVLAIAFLAGIIFALILPGGHKHD